MYDIFLLTSNKVKIYINISILEVVSIPTVLNYINRHTSGFS